jgi:hypothetical protein
MTGNLRHIFLEDAAQWFHHLFISNDGPKNIRIEEAKKRVLDTFVEPLLSAEVEALVYRICQGNHYMFYDTEVGECIADTVEILDRYPFAHRNKQIFSAEGTRGLWNMAENFRRFREVGFDPHQAICERVHTAGKKFYIKTRINDAHVSAPRLWFDYGGSRARATNFLLSQPELWLGYHDQKRRERGLAMVNDFAHEKVRNQRLAEIEEICKRYELDGLELNFCRSYHLFKEQEIDLGRELLTDFMRQMRGILDRIGGERGRRIEAIVRFHVSLEARHYQDMEYADGADIVGWMKEELVDMVVPTVPVAAVEGARYLKKYVDAAKDFPCAVFAGTRNPNHDDLTLRPITQEILRAQICSYERAGVDGVYYWWPRIDPSHANWNMLQEIGHPDRLARGDKHFIASKNLPLTLREGENEVSFLMADDLHQATEEGVLQGVRLRVRILHLRPDDRVRFEINGVPVPDDAILEPVTPAATWITGRIDATLTKATLPAQDENRLTVVVERGDGAETPAMADDTRRLSDLILRNVEVTVRYRSEVREEVASEEL